MKIEALKRTIETLEEIKSKVDPKELYIMYSGSNCIIGKLYGSFSHYCETIFKDFGLYHKNNYEFKPKSVEQVVSNLFYSNGELTGKQWIKKCDKVLSKLNKKLAKKLKKQQSVKE